MCINKKLILFSLCYTKQTLVYNVLGLMHKATHIDKLVSALNNIYN